MSPSWLQFVHPRCRALCALQRDARHLAWMDLLRQEFPSPCPYSTVIHSTVQAKNLAIILKSFHHGPFLTNLSLTSVNFVLCTSYLFLSTLLLLPWSTICHLTWSPLTDLPHIFCPLVLSPHSVQSDAQKHTTLLPEEYLSSFSMLLGFVSSHTFSHLIFFLQQFYYNSFLITVFLQHKDTHQNQPKEETRREKPGGF